MSRSQKTYLDWEALGRSRKWLDYGLLCMYESAAIIVRGATTFVFEPLSGVLSWDGFEIVSPVSGALITISSGSISANDGDIIFIRNIEHPFETAVKTLSVGAPLDVLTRKPTNLFLGTINGGAVYVFPSSEGPATPLSFLEQAFVTVESGQDGGTPPAVLETVTNGNGTVRIRKFSNLANNNLVFPWEVPTDIVGNTVNVGIAGIFSDAAMTAAGMYFTLKGYSVGNNDALGGSWGSEVALSPAGTYAQYDRLETVFSEAVPLANLDTKKLIMLHVERQPGHASDTYNSAFGIYGIKLQWTRKPTL